MSATVSWQSAALEQSTLGGASNRGRSIAAIRRECRPARDTDTVGRREKIYPITQPEARLVRDDNKPRAPINDDASRTSSCFSLHYATVLTIVLRMLIPKHSASDAVSNAGCQRRKSRTLYRRGQRCVASGLSIP